MRWLEAKGKPLHALAGRNPWRDPFRRQPGDRARHRALFDRIDQFLGEGYRRIKLKIGPGQDVDVVRQVRERYPAIPLQVDANSAYTLADLATLKQLDAFDLLLIEQPLAHDDIIDHARLQAELATPICLDESIHSAEDARKALDLGACRVINIKVSRLGGLLEARRVHDHCLARGVPVWCGGMHEFGIGRAANVAISSLPGFTLARRCIGLGQVLSPRSRRSADPGCRRCDRRSHRTRPGRRARRGRDPVANAPHRDTEREEMRSADG